MAQKRTVIPLAAMEKVLKMVKPDMRVSEPAKVVLSQAVKDYAMKISEISVRAAEHAKRKTVKDVDIELAVQNLAKSF